MKNTSLAFRQNRSDPRAKIHTVTIVEAQAGFIIFSTNELNLDLILTASFWKDAHWQEGHMQGLKTSADSLVLELS